MFSFCQYLIGSALPCVCACGCALYDAAGVVVGIITGKGSFAWIAEWRGWFELCVFPLSSSRLWPYSPPCEQLPSVSCGRLPSAMSRSCRPRASFVDAPMRTLTRRGGSVSTSGNATMCGSTCPPGTGSSGVWGVLFVCCPSPFSSVPLTFLQLFTTVCCPLLCVCVLFSCRRYVNFTSYLRSVQGRVMRSLLLAGQIRVFA
jgi:hypothetical protein